MTHIAVDTMRAGLATPQGHIDAIRSFREDFMIRTKGLTHIHLIVRDIERSLHFYRSVFGMREQFKVGDEMVFLHTPRSKDLITLHEDGDAADVAGTSGGIAHFGFSVVDGDLAAAIKEVKKAGGKLLERGEHSPGAPYAYVADPDGYIIELAID